MLATQILKMAAIFFKMADICITHFSKMTKNHSNFHTNLKLGSGIQRDVFYQIKTLAIKKIKMAVIFQDGGFFALFFSVFLDTLVKQLIQS